MKGYKFFGLALLVVVLVLLLDGCAAPVRSGTVTEKGYTAEEHDYDRVCTLRRAAGSCSTWAVVPDHEPACWRLYLRAANGATGSVCVPEDAWTAATVGGQYP